jgi:hypothetical protein
VEPPAKAQAAHTGAALEWPLLLERIAERCASRATSAYVHALLPADTLAEARHRLDRMRDALALFDAGHPLPAREFPELGELFERVRADGITGATFKFSDKERELAEKLIDQLSSEQFEPEKCSDSYSTRVNQAVQQKVEGKEITIAPEAPKAQIIDLFEALKKSLAGTSKADNATEKGEAPIRPPKKTAPKAEKSEQKKTRAKG